MFAREEPAQAHPEPERSAPLRTKAIRRMNTKQLHLESTPNFSSWLLVSSLVSALVFSRIAAESPASLALQNSR
jgi:hypothetical protein